MSPRQPGWAQPPRGSSSNQPWEPAGARRPDLRIGDAERERAASALAEHYAVGRITQEEHAERLDRIWAARTQAEVDPVFADLPGHPSAAAPGSRPQPAVRKARSGFRGIPGPLVLLLAVLGLVAVVTNFPLILIGIGVWFFFLRGGCGSRSSWGHHPRRW